ncbi:MAG: ABC transporter permease [Bacteroidetes bacterium]|nr:MAG: ABC transporter permease [Bacteroidota bacterium]REJ99723.1 MAG: ABC transporter permease [Bacteroidota bacterium]REK32917.1 MAG: ABC transporter permease [Bacteroidota bacterium]REK47722.1 MAG: ABC transporter permease [Bacteroidota bacterium]
MEYEIKPRSRIHLNFSELWLFRELTYFFVWRDIKIKYKQTVLGASWAILQPVLLMLIFTLFFSRIIGQKELSMPYPAFVFSGLIFWNVFASGLANAGNSMVSNANIIKKIYFPRIIIPISSVLSTLVDFSISFVLFLILTFIYPMEISWLSMIIVLPISLCIVLFTTFGLGSLLAALNVKYRDFRYVIPFFIQILLFLTPVIYPVSIIPEGILLDILLLNPLATALDIFRAAVSGAEMDFMLMTRGLLFSVVLLIAGMLYFRKTEYYFADLA